MNCRKAQKWLSLEMDGELSPSRKAQLGTHVASCAECSRVREGWGDLRRQFQEREISPDRTPDAAWADVQRAIRVADGARQAEGAPWGVGLRWAATAAALILLAGGWFITLKRPSDTRWVAPPPEGGRVEWVETGLPGASPMVYEDIESGLVIIWVVEADPKELPHAGT